MSLEAWFLFLAVAILPAISPGPGMLLALSNSLTYGSRATLYSAIGNSIGLLVLGLAVGFGLEAVLAVSASAFTIIKIAGAAYLVYLGIKLWRDKHMMTLPGRIQPAVFPGKLFRQALLISLTNPKAMVLIAALFPPFVDHTRPVVSQVAVMSVTYAVMCFGNHLLIAHAGGKIRRFLSSELRIAAVRRVLGSMFIGFGAALAMTNR